MCIMATQVRKSATPQIASIVASGTAAANCLTVNVANATDLAIDLTGTWVGTVTFEATIDGTNWAGLGVKPSNATTVTTFVLTSTANGMFVVDATPFKAIRARCSAYTSGTIVAKGQKAIQ